MRNTTMVGALTVVAVLVLLVAAGSVGAGPSLPKQALRDVGQAFSLSVAPWQTGKSAPQGPGEQLRRGELLSRPRGSGLLGISGLVGVYGNGEETGVVGVGTVELPPPTPVVVGSWQSWTNANYVNALAVDEDYVWAGTAGGVVHWSLRDGSYVKYLAPHGLPDNYVSAVAVDHAGRLWFGLGTWNGGVTVYDAGTWTTFAPRDGLVTGWVFAFGMDAAERKWIGTARGVSVLSDNGTSHEKGDDTWTTFKEADGLVDDRVLAVAMDRTGARWFGTSAGASVLSDGGSPHDKGDDTWTTFTTTHGLAGDSVQVIAVDDAGLKWFGTWDAGVSVLDDGGTPHARGDDTWTTFTADDGLMSNYVRAIAFDEAGHRWFAGSGGASVLDDAGTPHDKGDDTWITFTPTDGLAGYSVWAVAVGAGNQLWFGAWSDGVSRLNHAGTPFDKGDDLWTSYVAGDWLPYNDVEAVTTEGADLAWIGTGGGLVAFDGTNWTIFDTGRVMAIARDEAGGKWLGTMGGAKVLSDGGTPHDVGDDTWTTFTTDDGLVYGWVEGITIDAAGRKWFTTGYGGASVLDDNGTPHDKSDDRWTSFTAADGLAGDRPHVSAADGPNRVWFAHESDGVSLLDHAGTPHDKSDDVWTIFTPADGLAGNSVYAIVVDEAGRKWFGACGGVSVLDDAGTPHDKADDAWTTFRVGDCNQGLAIDPWGRKWVATGWSGVRVLDDAGTPHDQGDDTWRVYTRVEGLVEDRAQAIAVSSGGTVWVGTDGGLGRMVAGLRERLYLPLVLRDFPWHGVVVEHNGANRIEVADQGSPHTCIPANPRFPSQPPLSCGALDVRHIDSAIVIQVESGIIEGLACGGPEVAGHLHDFDNVHVVVGVVVTGQGAGAQFDVDPVAVLSPHRRVWSQGHRRMAVHREGDAGGGATAPDPGEVREYGVAAENSIAGVQVQPAAAAKSNDVVLDDVAPEGGTAEVRAQRAAVSPVSTASGTYSFS